jgi:hypothetical protein
MSGRKTMDRVVVCLLIHGEESYFTAGRQAALSVLQYSDFDLFLVLGPGPDLRLRNDARIHRHHLSSETTHGYRARPFLRKFHALQTCLENTEHRWLMLLDADAMLVRTITQRMVQLALANSGFGMVEQTTIQGSTMNRADFHHHYVRHSLAWLAPGTNPPKLSDFRYYNSGVVLGRRQEFVAFSHWALGALNTNPGDHRVGEHMIGDQDYFQFWTNSLHLEDRNTLPWFWNHCEHWDEGFPRKEAYILHFSNFCRAPTPWQILRMALMRRGAARAASACRRIEELLARK